MLFLLIFRVHLILFSLQRRDKTSLYQVRGKIAMKIQELSEKQVRWDGFSCPFLATLKVRREEEVKWR